MVRVGHRRQLQKPPGLLLPNPSRPSALSPMVNGTRAPTKKAAKQLIMKAARDARVAKAATASDSAPDNLQALKDLDVIESLPEVFSLMTGCCMVA